MLERIDPAERIEILAKETPFQGYFRVDRYRLRHRLFAGGWSGEMTREVFERGHAAAVLPYDPRADAVLLIQQFRIGAFAAGLDPWLIEIVAGIIEDDESPLEVVRREALEEAGCTIGRVAEIGRVLLTPGAVSETLTLFCGEIDSRGLGGIHGLDSEHEDIRAFVVPVDEALDGLAKGTIANASTVIALQWLALNRQRLRAAWA